MRATALTDNIFDTMLTTAPARVLRDTAGGFDLFTETPEIAVGRVGQIVLTRQVRDHLVQFIEADVVEAELQHAPTAGLPEIPLSTSARGE